MGYEFTEFNPGSYAKDSDGLQLLWDTSRTLCDYLVEQSIGLVTTLNGRFGYEVTSTLAKQALETGKSIRELVIEQQFLSSAEADLMLDPQQMLQPNLR